MPGAIYYPKASRTAQWFGGTYPGVDMGGVEKVLLHTTETGGWPGYGGGASAPNLTYHPRLREWRQHFRLDRSARALRDPSGTAVRENRDRVVQVEIVCSSDPQFARKYGYLFVEDLSRDALRDLGDFVRFMHDQWGVPLRAAPLWLPYPDSYGATRARMTGPEYDAFKGVLGHMHASGNQHGDPGAIDILRIMAHATAGGTVSTTGPEKWDAKDWAAFDQHFWGRQVRFWSPSAGEIWGDRPPPAIKHLLDMTFANSVMAIKAIAEDDANDLTQDQVRQLLADAAIDVTVTVRNETPPAEPAAGAQP